MKKYTLLIIAIVVSVETYSQKIKTIEFNQICDPPKKEYGNNVEAVDEFRDSLKATIQIDRITLGTNVEEVNRTFEEVFKDETQVYRLNNEMAISVSVARVVENDKKFYVYKLHLFRKIKGCWEDVCWDHAYSKFNLGNFTSGHGVGNEGSSTYIGFQGNVTIE
jgi:hypothetical protein